MKSYCFIWGIDFLLCSEPAVLYVPLVWAPEINFLFSFSFYFFLLDLRFNDKGIWVAEDRSFFLKVKMKFNSFSTCFVHRSKTSSVFQVSSLSESEESQDSSDSIGSSQKTHGILARRPSYR